MAILIIPAAGLSTRFGLEKPKFLLQSPHGRPMIAEALSGFRNLEKAGVTSIQIITQGAYLENLSLEVLRLEIQGVTSLPVHFKLLDGPTQSMVHTLRSLLVDLESDEEFIVKDCDNIVGLDICQLDIGPNVISYVDLKEHPNVVAHNKSFLKINGSMILDDIIEKEIVSPYINVGCVKFGSASSFLSALNAFEGSGELYVSDIVRVLISRGELFHAVKAEIYEDWGTLSEWRSYCRRFATYFIDIDGVVSLNMDPLKLLQNWQNLSPMEKNCSRLLELQENGHLVFTTSRHPEHRSTLENQLKEIGFTNFDLLMGLPHAQRILINDFAPTNPYPSASAINIPRNSDSLGDYI
jgi:hypothetical protein